jgi:hypothetical protein
MPSMAPITRLSAHHGDQCGAMCVTMRSSADNDDAKYGINHSMNLQSWRLRVAPSMAPGVRPSAEYGANCGEMVYLMVYPPWRQV